MNQKPLMEKLNKIDFYIKRFINKAVKEIVDDPEVYSFKTEFKDKYYLIHLHHGILRKSSKESIPFRTLFQEICSDEDRLELEMNRIIRKLIIELKDNNNKIFVVK